MPFLTAFSAFQLGRRCYTFPQRNTISYSGVGMRNVQLNGENAMYSCQWRRVRNVDETGNADSKL